MTALCKEYFGGCPDCGRCLILHVGRAHWGTCPDHRVKWLIGAGLFTVHDDNPDWPNHEVLRAYREVEPLQDGAKIPEPAKLGVTEPANDNRPRTGGMRPLGTCMSELFPPVGFAAILQAVIKRAEAEADAYYMEVAGQPAAFSSASKYVVAEMVGLEIVREVLPDGSPDATGLASVASNVFHARLSVLADGPAGAA